VLGVTYRLRAGGGPTLRYPELMRAIGGGSGEPSLAAVREAVLDLRRSKSMVIEASDPNRRSVGSFFVNPVVTAERADDIACEVGKWELPRFPTDGGVKLPAAWLIERCGYAKGHRRGEVGLSSRHTLALVHHGGATTMDLVDLAREIRGAVRHRFGIDLEPEPTFLGFSDKDPTAEPGFR
jgi:UDP-N-acetylmuramate dehydrogenase